MMIAEEDYDPNHDYTNDTIKRPTYKHSKLGWTPEQWCISRLNNHLDYVDYRGKSPIKADSGTFLVTAKNIKKGVIDYEISKEYIPNDTYNTVMGRGEVEMGDILITTEAPLGNVAQVDRENVALAQRVIKYRPKNRTVDKNYLKWYFLSHRFQKELLLESTGSTVKGIKGSRLHKLPLILPPLPEQKKIAQILSTWDKAISKMEQLIAKKQERKKGLMQQLLTGKKRFKEFVKSDKMKETKLGLIPEDWGEVRLNDLIDKSRKVRYGIVQPGDYDPNGRFMVRGQDYSLSKGWNNPENLFRVSHVVEVKYKKARLKGGDLILTIVGAGTGHAQEIPDWLEGANITQTTARIAINQFEADNKFYLQYLNSDLGKKQTYRFIKGGAQPGLNIRDVEVFNLAKPQLMEQRKIASVLSSADQELNKLLTQLDQLKEQKKGLMQKLLTGEVRVKID